MKEPSCCTLLLCQQIPPALERCVNNFANLTQRSSAAGRCRQYTRSEVGGLPFYFRSINILVFCCCCSQDVCSDLMHAYALGGLLVACNFEFHLPVNSIAVLIILPAFDWQLIPSVNGWQYHDDNNNWTTEPTMENIQTVSLARRICWFVFIPLLFCFPDSSFDVIHHCDFKM